MHISGDYFIRVNYRILSSDCTVDFPVKFSLKEQPYAQVEMQHLYVNHGARDGALLVEC